MLEVIPFKVKQVGTVVTGNEVFKGRIKDKFGKTIKRKVKVPGSVINHQIMIPDDEELITQAIAEMRAKGTKVIVVCGELCLNCDGYIFPIWPFGK